MATPVKKKPSTKDKVARFCVVDGLFVCDERDYCAEDWEENATILWYEIVTTQDKLSVNRRFYHKLQG